MAFLSLHDMPVGTFKIILIECFHSILNKSQLLGPRPSLSGRGIALTGVLVVKC
jgi:hypothetical protein